MTYSEIEKLYEKNEYKFRTEDYALNIFGIRSKESRSNKFDDKIGIAWRVENSKFIIIDNATTDPGKYWLELPSVREGTIIVVPNQYTEVYEKGLHAGKYDAFKQCAPMVYVRDNDRNMDLDFSLYRDLQKRKIHSFSAIRGTNLHRASENKIVQFVEKYSAGCQVVQNPTFFARMIMLRDLSISEGYKKFDYTLFEEL